MAQGFTRGVPIDTDPTMSLDSEIVVPSQSAVRDYVANNAVIPNAPITGDTKTKVTYDSKGLVTAGADIVATDISDSTDVGRNLVKLANPNAITYLRVNANNSVTPRTPAQVLTDLGISANIILYRNFADTSNVGTAVNQIVYTALIPANTLQANDWINLKTFLRINGAASTGATVFINTTPTIPIVSPIAIATFTIANNQGGLYDRNFMITSIGPSGVLKYFQGTALSAYTPANFSAVSVTINTTVDQYLVFATAAPVGVTFVTNGTIIQLTR